jgi:hypothetical protein
MDDQPPEPERSAPATHAEIVAAGRHRREAAALRDNLARRKAQSRERARPSAQSMIDLPQDDAPCR